MPVYTRRWPPVVQQACCRHLTVVLVRRRQHTYILSCKVSSQYSQNNTHDLQHTTWSGVDHTVPRSDFSQPSVLYKRLAARAPGRHRARTGGGGRERRDEANKFLNTLETKSAIHIIHKYIYTQHLIGRLLSSQSYTYALKITRTVLRGCGSVHFSSLCGKPSDV